ncbi:LacI family DNA-binding transcriptional regulator [Pantoea vagans]|uniref:LacI family DNA-binding transcriptional regulator n=1 Tax=Pantoea vagans TaxID=470934 RepID=UPI0028AAB3D7|nr:LacI family DNA-binding transcriptional regulator [Pantoea vagans]
MKKLTLEVVAKMAGVGIATVDRVLNERGGVSLETSRKVLKAAREAGLRRLLPEEYQHPWQIEVFLSNNGSSFFQQLTTCFSEIASQLGYRRLKLHKTLVAEAQPEQLAQSIVARSSTRDGIIVFAHDSPPVYRALALCRSRNVPVITIVTDLPDADRLCHVGIDQYQAGRTAGLLMSKTLNQPGDILMVSGRFDYRAHRQRIAGFREAMEQRAPQRYLREVLSGQDQRETIRSELARNLRSSQAIAGVYNTGMGNTDVSDTLRAHQLLGKCTYITHELYDVTRQLLLNDEVAFTLDQHARQHARLAIDLMLSHLETGYQPDVYQAGKVAFRLFTVENMV